jgi:peptidoglycan-associated lipoprotein
MRQDRSWRWFLIMAFVLTLMLAAGGCKKKPKVAPPPPPPPPAPAAPWAKLSVDPSTLTAGQSSTLSWTTGNASDVSIDPGIGKVNLEGSQTITPGTSTTYTLTAKGPGGTASDTARVTVNPIAVASPLPPSALGRATFEELWERNVKTVFFDYDKADIRADMQAVINNDAEFLKAHPTWKFTIEGNCDERGSIEYNLALGDRRANAAKAALVAAGVSADHIKTISYGKEKSRSCADESCWQQDRNAKFVLNEH